MICTNNSDFFNYLQNKGVHTIMYFRPVEGLLNIFFPETHNITICGNRYNQQRIESGDMKREFEELKKLIEFPNTIVITGVTLFGGKLHREVYPNSVIDIKGQRIHTKQLGEIVYPRYVKIYGATLKPITNIEPNIKEIEYGKQGKKQQDIYWNTFYNKCSKEERRKKRYLPEWALYSALYYQVIKGGGNNE